MSFYTAPPPPPAVKCNKIEFIKQTIEACVFAHISKEYRFDDKNVIETYGDTHFETHSLTLSFKGDFYLTVLLCGS